MLLTATPLQNALAVGNDMRGHQVARAFAGQGVLASVDGPSKSPLGLPTAGASSFTLSGSAIEDEDLEQAFSNLELAMEASRKKRLHGRTTPSFKDVAEYVGKVVMSKDGIQ